MQYRKFGKLDWQPSALGFGAMRLPTLGTEMSSPVDEPEAIRMIRYAIDHGVNYVDTAYGYHGGNSEKVVGKALQDGYREKIKLATKMPVNMVQMLKTPQDLDRIFNEQLERLQTPRINFYLLHGLNKAGWQRVHDMGILRWAEGRMAAGQIDYLGFSFHDEFTVFKDIIDGYDNWTFCQVLYNYIDVNKQAGRRGVEYAAGKGLGIVVMEPLRGGMLTKVPPAKVAGIWEQAPQKHSLPEWGLQWVWSQPEISLLLSGMSTMPQVVENISLAERSGVVKLTSQEMAIYDRVRETYSSLAPVPCTKCRYCAPCPNGVDIPGIFDAYNEVVVYNEPRIAQMRYQGPMGIKPDNRADKCVECGSCVEKCPQKIAIPEELKKAHQKLSAKP